jgi:uncharacterized RDD family membrane protein YckC
MKSERVPNLFFFCPFSFTLHPSLFTLLYNEAAVFCSACGAKNDVGTPQCFVCKKSLPSPDAERLPPRPRPTTVASTAEIQGSIGDRMLALVFDRILLAALLTIPASLVAGHWSRIQGISSILWRSVEAAAVVLIAIFIYHVAFEASFGLTPGKAIFGLRVRNEVGRSRFAAALIRNAVRFVDVLILYAVGFLIALFSPRRQRLGDHMAGTVVNVVPVHWAARAGILLLWLAAIGGSLWLSAYLCPSCVPSIPPLRLPF